MLDLDVFPEIGFELRKVLGDRIFQRKLPFFSQLQDGYGRELLGNRGDIEESVAVDGLFRVDVRDAISFVEKDIVTAHDEDSGAGFIGREERRAKLVEFGRSLFVG